MPDIVYFSEINDSNFVTDTENGCIVKELTKFCSDREFTDYEWIVKVFIDHFNHYADGDYTFILKTESLAEAQRKFAWMLHHEIESYSPLLCLYIRDKEATFGNKDVNIWTDNDRKLEVEGEYGSSSRTGGENSPLGNTAFGDINTPSQKSQNEIEGSSGRTETRSGSSTETRYRSDETEQLKQYWKGFGNFDTMIHWIFGEMTNEYTTVY